MNALQKHQIQIAFKKLQEAKKDFHRAYNRVIKATDGLEAALVEYTYDNDSMQKIKEAAERYLAELDAWHRGSMSRTTTMPDIEEIAEEYGVSHIAVNHYLKPTLNPNLCDLCGCYAVSKEGDICSICAK